MIPETGGWVTIIDEAPYVLLSRTYYLQYDDIDELVSKVIVQKSKTLLGKSGRKSARVIENDDISAMFGIEIEAKSEKPVPKKRGRK